MKMIRIVLVWLICSPAFGQTLQELLNQAETNYPLLKAKAFEVQAGQSNISSVKSSAIPSLDAGYQINYATYNNITGMVAPQSIVPMTGPPSADNTYGGVYGSAASLLLNWEAFTFGQRKGRVDLAKANLLNSEADAKQEIFKHKINFINAYLDVLMAHELLKVISKNLDRSKENVRAVGTLAKAGLRPGVDTALFNAELSRAKIELLNYEKYLETQKVSLAELLGKESVSYSIDSSYFHNLPSEFSDSSSVNHPLVVLSNTRILVNQQQRTIIQRTLYPKLGVWGTTYARGSGVSYNGVANSTDGLSFSRYNYGVGLQLSVPLLRFTDTRHQLRSQDALIHAQEERLNLVKLQLNKENKIADVTLSKAFEIAKESPVFFQSAEFSYHALQTRYNTGLTNYADLIQSQYGLVKAETNLKKSYLEVWKALLYKAAVKGDINLFLNQVK
jgi:outer membrane protein TolC